MSTRILGKTMRDAVRNKEGWKGTPTQYPSTNCNDADAAYVARAASEQGTELHGMLFRVNGADFF